MIVETTYNFILADEMAFYRQKLWDEWYTSTYPTLTSARIVEIKFAIVSTPKGLNQFDEMWCNAVKGINLFKPFRALWTEKPWKNQEEMDKFRIDTIAQIGKKRFDQEFNCEHISSSNALLSSNALSQIEPIDPIRFFFDRKFKIYREPIQNHNYIIVGDLSEGVGADSSVLNIIDISMKPFEQAAIYKDNKTAMHLLPDIMIKLSKMYNNALLIPEYASSGVYVCNKLWNDLAYEFLYYDNESNIPGIRTTKLNRQIGILNLKELMENGMLTVYDADTLKELSNFIKSGGRYEGVEDHDDIVMTLVLFGFIVTTQYFKDLYDISWIENFRLQQSKKLFNGNELNISDKEEEYNDFQGMMIYQNNQDNDDIEFGEDYSDYSIFP